MQISFASTIGSGNKNDNKELSSQQQEKTESAKPDNQLSDELDEGVSGEKEIAQDSAVDYSVSKYNFILYFLYKFKYEEEDSPD